MILAPSGRLLHQNHVKNVSPCVHLLVLLLLVVFS